MKTEKIQILIVENEFQAATDLANRLNRFGYQTCGQAETGPQALELVDRLKPALVIMNIILQGGMDGIETARVLKDQWHIPLIFLITDEDSDRLKKADLPHPFGYLLKPVQDRDLKIAVEMALDAARAGSKRRRAEEALLQNRDRDQALLSAIPDLLCVLDHDCRFLDCQGNPPGDLFPRPEELVGRLVEEVMQPHIAQLLRTNVEQPLASGTSRRFLFHLETHGGKKDFEARMVVMKKNQILVVFRDVTEQQKTVDALRESDERLRLAHQATKAVVWDWNVGRHVERWYEAGEALFGWPDISKHPKTTSWWLKRVHPDDRTKIKDSFHQLMEQAEHNHWTSEYRFLRADGTYAQVMDRAFVMRDERGRPVRMIGAMMDVSERERMKEKISSQGGLITSLLDLIPDIIFYKGTDGVYLGCNSGFAQSVGREKEDIIGKTDYDLFSPKKANAYRQNDRRILAFGATRRSEEWISYPDGQRVLLDVLQTPYRDANGKIIGILVTGRDITDRKKAEEALRESEQRMELALFGADLGTWDWNVQSGEMTFNRRWAEMLGFEPDRITGKDDYWAELIHPGDLPEVMKALKAHLKGQTDFFESEHRVRHQSGEWIWILDKGRIIQRDPKGKPLRVCGTHLAITERKQAEEMLLLQAMTLGQIEDRVTVTDLEGHITYVNQAECRMFGKSREELVGCHVSVFGEDPSIGATQSEIIQKTLKDGAWRGEITNYKEDGSAVILDCRTHVVRDPQGKVVALCGISTDITIQKKIEHELKASEERFSGIFSTSPIGIAIVNTEDQRFVQANESFLKLIGYSEEELLELTVEDLTDGDDLEVEPPSINKYPQNDTDFHEAVKKFIRKDGEIRYVQVTGDELHLHPDTPPLAVANVIDITERVKSQKDREKLQIQLQQAQKMEAIGTLAGGVAHDFNNLIQAISGYTQIMLLDQPQNSEDVSRLKAIEHASGRAADLVRQLLLFSRKAEPERKSLNINEEIEEVRGILERTIPKMVEIKIHLGNRLPQINADPVQIEQILLNLGANAADAMPEGGVLVIETEKITLDQDFAWDQLGVEPGNYVLLTVSDTGQGMDRSTREKMFEPFFTTKEFGKGTGLGLASVYGIVKSHGGHITCYSAVGQGTVFRVYLPSLDPMVHVEKEQEELRPPKGGEETILLVDDEESIRDFGSQILTQFGYAVLTASSGEEALDIFSRNAHQIDLVILDIGMPGMGGYKCLEEIKRQTPSAKVLIASGYSINGEGKKPLEVGAAGFVGKPYRLTDFLDSIRTVLDRQD